MRHLLLLLILIAASPALADVYVLGSSFSWDAQPALLAGSRAWHIDCGRSLGYIRANPGFPCERSSTNWPGALPVGDYAYVSFQPVPGRESTRASDVAAISAWMAMQSNAIGVIHPTWSPPGVFHADFHAANPDHTLTNNSREYYDLLVTMLREQNPGRVFYSDRSNEMLDAIYHDILAGKGPLTDFMQLFRDESGHMSFDIGRYLMHNALRQAFGQSTGANAGAFGVSPEVEAYIDGVVARFAPVILPPLERVPTGTGVFHFTEKTRLSGGCDSEQVLRTARVALRQDGTFLIKHPGVDLRGRVRKLDRKGRKWGLDLDEASVAAYLELLRARGEALCGFGLESVVAEADLVIRYYEGDGRVSWKLRTRGHAQTGSGTIRVTHKVKGRTIAWN